jgi:hypothetical protein
MNNFGIITGSYLDASGVWHGFLLGPDGKFTTLDVPGADMTPGDFNGTFPETINTFGAVTGVYIDVNNVYHGFVAVPCTQRCVKSHNETAATSTSALTNTKQISPASSGVLNPRFRLLRSLRRLEAQPSK